MYLLYSLVAAITIGLSNYFVLTSFNFPNSVLISTCTFFFAFFTYSLDHYFDNQKTGIDKEKMHLRHQISTKDYQFANKGIALTAMLCLYFFYFLPKPYLYTGLLLAGISMLYFFLVFKKIIGARYKILIAAIILSLVIAIWLVLDGIDWPLDFGYLSIVFLTIYSNLKFFSYIDSEYDQHWFHQNKQKPLAKNQLLILLSISTILIFIIGFLIGKGQSWMFATAVYLFVCLIVNKKTLQQHFWRMALDIIMLLPLLKLLW